MQTGTTTTISSTHTTIPPYTTTLKSTSNLSPTYTKTHTNTANHTSTNIQNTHATTSLLSQH
jgi:hypothetical protein